MVSLCLFKGLIALGRCSNIDDRIPNFTERTTTALTFKLFYS